MAMRDAGCALFLLGMVARPEQGLEADGIAGGGRYRTQSCGTNPAYSYYAEETYAGRLRYVAGNGLTGAVDASGSRAVLKQGPGTNRDAFDAAARVGWHGLYGGLEGGVAAHRRDEKTEALPSALLWAGLPEIHLYGSLLSNRFAVNQADFTVGVGHTGKWVAVNAGLGIQGFSADLEARVLPYVSPALSVRYNSSDNWNVAGGLTFRFDP